MELFWTPTRGHVHVSPSADAVFGTSIGSGDVTECARKARKSAAVAWAQSVVLVRELDLGVPEFAMLCAEVLRAGVETVDRLV
jgi:hypothetical protein